MVTDLENKAYSKPNLSTMQQAVHIFFIIFGLENEKKNLISWQLLG